MIIHPDFITEANELELAEQIVTALSKTPERKGWLRNRVIRFGHDYDTEEWLGPIPPWISLVQLGLRNMAAPDIVPEGIDSITINEYLRGQRIAPHFDSEKFGDVAILSLLADVTMRFTSPTGKTQDFVLPRRSLAVMSGELRHSWQHETLPLEADLRYSIVYRKRL